MNSDEVLEAQLRRLKPAAPSPALLARLQMARPAPEAQRVPWRTWLWRAGLPLAAAAGVTVMVATRAYGPASAPVPVQTAAVTPRVTYDPVETRDFILGAQTVGIGHTANGRPYRVLHGYGVRRAMWRNSADGTEVAAVVPQQNLMVAKLDVY